MTIEKDIIDALEPLVGDHVYPDIAPAGVLALPRITFQQVGGRAFNYIEASPVGKKNCRMQVNAWGNTRLQAAALSRQIEDTLKSTPGLYTTVLSAPVATYEPDTRLYGTRQDFSFFF